MAGSAKRDTSAPKIMAIASGGGHWIELRRLMPAFADLDVFYVSTDRQADADLPEGRYYAVTNVTRRNRFAFLTLIRELAGIIRRERPTVVISTGAAPGLVGLILARLFCRSRTLWIDTFSHAESITLSGRLARPFCDAWLVQWAHLAKPGGPEYWGEIL